MLETGGACMSRQPVLSLKQFINVAVFLEIGHLSQLIRFSPRLYINMFRPITRLLQAMRGRINAPMLVA